MPADEFQLLEDFKTLYASRFAPYLIDEYHRRLDASLRHVGREVHFYVRDHGKISAVLRLRGRPFEWELLLPTICHHADTWGKCAEFSRLMVEPSARGLRAGQILIGTAALWAIDEGYDGVVALCRRESCKVFRQYGLSCYVESPVRVHQRENGEYFLMTGVWSDIAHSKGTCRDLVVTNDEAILTVDINLI